MTAVVLSLAPHVEDRLLPLLLEEGHVVVARPASAAEALATVGRTPADALLATASPRHCDAALLTAAAAAGMTVVLLAAGPGEREHAAALGVPEPVPADASTAEVLGRLDRPLEAPPVDRAAGPKGPRRGRITAVWGPTGAPGRTTTAIALAAELAATGLRVALVDADTVGAAVAPALGLFDEAPGLAAACRLAAAGALDGAELDRVAQQHRGARGAFSVLTGIGRPSRWPELSTDRMTTVLEACRGWADHTVVDTGFNLETDEEIVSDLFAPRRNAATIAALRAADTVVAVGAGDPVGLARFVRAYGDLLELVDPAAVRVVIGKVRASAVGIGPAGQIRASLLRFGGIEDATLVPSDPGACDAALLTARSLPDAAPRSAATAALRRFALEHLAERPSAPPRRGLVRLRRAQPA
ncbi:MAG: nucleotide-binding protein [Amnibacterium sp.]